MIDYPEEIRIGYRSCPSCGREHFASNLSGMYEWCPQCSASSPEDMAIREGWVRKANAAAARQGHLETAQFLRRMGYPDRAQVHEYKARH